MSLYSELQDVFVGELSADEQQELAKFAACMLKAKRKKDAKMSAALVKQASDEIYDLDDYDRVISLLAYLRSVPDLQKEASWKRAADYALKGAAITSALAPLAMTAYKAKREASALEKSFKEIIQEHPVLGAAANLPMTRRYFDALVSFAPPVAMNSLVAGNVIARMHRLGPAMMDINMVKELVSTNKAHQEASEKATSGRKPLVSGVADAVTGVAAAFGHKPGDTEMSVRTDRLDSENKHMSAAKQHVELKQWLKKHEAEKAMDAAMVSNAKAQLKTK